MRRIHSKQINGAVVAPHRRAARSRRSACLCAAEPGPSAFQTSGQQDVAWDPKGLLANAGPKQAGLLERKLAERRAAQAQAGTATLEGPPIRRLSAQALARGGLAKGEDEAGFSWDELAQLPVNLDTPGLRLLNIEPAIFAVDGFLDAETCAAFVGAAGESGLMQGSGIGGGALFSEDNIYSSRRTSTSLLLDASTLHLQPALRALALRMQQACRDLVTCPEWSSTGKVPPPGNVCFEALQLARYDSRQHFLAHEDGFPMPMARANGFQRAATVLLYLNTVPEGGRTRFEHLDVSIAPLEGRAVLFFPSFEDGRPDARTLHSACDAVDVKWVAQQWIARGLALEGEASAASPLPAAVLQSSAKAAGRTVLPALPARRKAKETRGAAMANLASRLSGVVADLSPVVPGQAKDEDETPTEALRRQRQLAKKAKPGKSDKNIGKGFG